MLSLGCTAIELSGMSYRAKAASSTILVYQPPASVTAQMSSSRSRVSTSRSKNDLIIHSESGREWLEFHPDVWADSFINNPSLPENTQAMTNERIKERVEELIEEVKVMLQEPNDILQKMVLVDKLHRFGVNYHFEQEIAQALDIINKPSLDDLDDLYMVALRFRLLRQNRHNIATSVFNKFLDKSGNFKESLRYDAKGLLALYEAAYLSIPGDDILDKAKDFTRNHLKSMLNHLKPFDAKLVKHSLEMPLHRRMRRLEAKHYIDICQENESQKDVLLELAKLDFRLLQLLHREEIKTVYRSRKEMGLGANLKFAKERSAECYFWSLGVYYEPKYSSCRLRETKFLYLLTIMDDLYDNYGTYEELILLTDVINRWDMEAANQLEDHLKLPFLEMNRLMEDIEKELASNGKYDYTDYLKQILKIEFKMQLEDIKWKHNKYMPSMEECLRVRSVATMYHSTACAAFLCHGEEATPEILEWLTRTPKMIYALQAHLRIVNDIADYEFDLKTKHVATGVQCYMKQHNTTLEVAIEKLLEMVEVIWKIFNQEYLHQSRIPKALSEIVLNLIRVAEILYKGKIDHYRESEALKDHIAALVNQPIGL